MASGYLVAGKGSHTVAGTGQEQAKEWLNLVEPLLSSGRAYRLPYGNADVIGAARQGRSSLLLTVKHAVRAMRGRGGSIILTGSPTALNGEGADFTAYSLSLIHI